MQQVISLPEYMCRTGERELRKGFSLMELLLVIFIISLVYFLGFSGVEKPTKRKQRLTPLNLKQTIMANPLFHGKGTFLCINHCRTCYFREDISAAFEPFEGQTALPDMTVYTVNANENLQKQEYGRYQDNKICLRFDIFTNGSSSQLILQTQKETYFLPAYFGKPQKVESLDTARELWLKHTQDLSGQGDFY
jgi:prepilin-type N-terminal cleavage/methylation domain-containing protein